MRKDRILSDVKEEVEMLFGDWPLLSNKVLDWLALGVGGASAVDRPIVTGETRMCVIPTVDNIVAEVDCDVASEEDCDNDDDEDDQDCGDEDEEMDGVLMVATVNLSVSSSISKVT